MIRKIIHIDEEKCNGCGACAAACHEGAIEMVDGKAKLMRDDYCDGFGDCLPNCPTGAITFTEREAAAYDKEAVEKHMAERAQAQAPAAPSLKDMPHPPRGGHPGGCPGKAMRQFNREAAPAENTPNAPQSSQSRLGQWPCQIKLVPVNAPYFDGAKLLIAADCTAYAYARMHDDFMKGHITLIGCPKLDEGDYTEKLTQIIAKNNIKEVSIVRMEVPCCGGLENAAKRAIQNSGKFLPWHVTTISLDGKILD